MKNYHSIIIGSGINSLVCAAVLAKKGKKVLVLERSPNLGGCIQSEMLSNCMIDSLSTAYPLFVTSPGYAFLKDDLAAEGIEFIANDTPTGTITDDKQFAIIKTNRKENVSNFEKLALGDGKEYEKQMEWVEKHSAILFRFLGEEIQTFKTAKFLGKYIWKTGVSQSLENIQSFIPSVRTDLPRYFKSNTLLATLAPWVLHSGLSTDSLFSSTMAKITAFAIEAVGLPLVKGGSYKIVEALQRIIEKNGGQCLTGKHVEEILTDSTKATGVTVQDGTRYNGLHIIANVTPAQLYEKLLKKSSKVPSKTIEQARNYKYGKGNMQIHLVLNEKPKWFNPELDTVTYVHLCNGIEDVSRAVNQAQNQLLPEKATICVAQPSAVDKSRASEGKYILWIQLPECPNFPIADASESLGHLTKGQWTKELKEAYADKIIDRISMYISNIKSATIAQKIISPKDLEQMNINLVNGDPYSGQCEMDQYLMWRPLGSVQNHETPIKNLYHIGASTHPGPGLGAVSGFLVARKILE